MILNELILGYENILFTNFKEMYNFFITYIYIFSLYIINIIFSFLKYKWFEIWTINTILIALIFSFLLTFFIIIINFILLRKINKIDNYNIFHMLPIFTLLFILIEFFNNIYFIIFWFIIYIILLFFYWKYLKNKLKK